ncbi:hypothetical protein OG613_05390 [Streptomyces sp. NBC_00015]|uniref:hypothetical protein n=1 Tax=Streptomyces sp. NBC_00015 TaxID=2903611 RepID=UPI00324C3587
MQTTNQTWARPRVDAGPARSVDAGRFLPVETLTGWQQALDDRGLRATGSAAHADYIGDLARRLSEAGVPDVALEAVPMRRWSARRWGLRLAGPDSGAEVAVVSPVAYSGRTGADGVTGPLSPEPRTGAIGVVDITLPAFTAGDFDALDYGPSALAAAEPAYAPDQPYERVWLAHDQMRAELARFAAAGAAGLILVIDLPEEELGGGYLLYDGVHRTVPALFVGRESGRRLHEAARREMKVKLTLVADAAEVDTHNIVGIIPGASDELVVLQSHTDGSNGLEDNGCEAILAMAHYLARLPRQELPRSVLVLLSTGHFATEEAWGLEAFLERHREDLVPRTAAALCLEHLGALVAPAGCSDHVPGVTYEFGACFATPHPAVVDSMRSALVRAQVTEPRVLRPFVPHSSGSSPDGTTWPGDGGPFWHTAGLPAANFITGPGYLLNVEPVMDRIDVAALRRQAIAFTEAVLELAAVPWHELRGQASRAADGPSEGEPR